MAKSWCIFDKVFGEAVEFFSSKEEAELAMINYESSYYDVRKTEN